jgi:hypothetical protein
MKHPRHAVLMPYLEGFFVLRPSELLLKRTRGGMLAPLLLSRRSVRL